MSERMMKKALYVVFLKLVLWQNVKNASVDLCVMSERKGCENEVENEGKNE